LEILEIFVPYPCQEKGPDMSKIATTGAKANSDEALLQKITAAVAAANEAEKTAETAKAELVSRSKVVGQLLLEAKKRHPKVADLRRSLSASTG